MCILSNIFHKIFPGSHPAVAQPAAPASAQPAPQGTAARTPAAAMPPVDIEAILSNMAAQAGQPLNWRDSIVDLLTLLNLDSNLPARQALAVERHDSGDRNDSSTMNIWLLRQVMVKLEENGGKVPAELKD